MQDRLLGNTGLTVSRIGFGTIPFKLRETPVEQGAELLASAYEMGVNFFDLAEIYGTYAHMREALKAIDGPVVIASKCMAKTADDMDRSIKTALDQIGVDSLDIFKLHSVDSLDDLESRRGAWQALTRAKAEGLVRAIGISTHSCKVLNEITNWSDVDVVLAVLNQGRQGVLEGTMAEMHQGIQRAHAAGKGVYLMKVLAAGLLYANARKALEFALSIPEADSMAIGMQNLQEVIFNVGVANGEDVPSCVENNLKARKRQWHVRPFCTACGTCIDECRYDALTMGEKTPVVNESKCTLCGYCGFSCPALAIKIL